MFLEKLLFGAGLGYALAVPAIFAQTIVPSSLTIPLEDAGAYHLCTDSWTALGGGGGSGYGPDVIYDNTGGATHFAWQGAGEGWSDWGRLPAVLDPDFPAADVTAWHLSGIRIAYVTDEPGELLGLRLRIHELAEPGCDPSSEPAIVDLELAGLPGADEPGVPVAWAWTIDFTGTEHDVLVAAAGDGVHDGDAVLDSFAVSLAFTTSGEGSIGPLLAGDPSAAAVGDGTLLGSGTTGTGIGNADGIWIADGETGALAAAPPSGVGSGVRRSLWLELHGYPFDEEASGGCHPTVNSTGLPGLLEQLLEEDAWRITVRTSQVPDQPAVIIWSLHDTSLPFGDGWRCIYGDTLVLAGPFLPVEGTAVVEIDLEEFPQVSGGFLQCIFRDPAAGGAGHNLTNAIELEL